MVSMTTSVVQKPVNNPFKHMGAIWHFHFTARAYPSFRPEPAFLGIHNFAIHVTPSSIIEYAWFAIT